MSLSLSGPLIGHCDRPSDWLAPVWPRGPCHIQLQDIVMQLSALYKERREGGLQSALIVKCPAQAETSCDLSLARAGLVSGRSDIS